MADYLATVRRIIEEHHKIRSDVMQVGESANDLAAVFSLQRAYSTWSQSSLDALAQKQDKLKETISLMAEGLDRHFSFEEEYLPPIFGEILMRALLLEHREIRRKLAEIKSAVNTRLEGLGQRELLAQRTHIQHVVGDIRQVIEEHASREEVILGMMERALAEGQSGQRQ
jgi:hemerythrin